VHIHLKIEPRITWNYRISPNFRTLVILLQVDFAFGDEHANVYKGFYEIKDNSIFAFYSILGIEHYRLLCGSIC
jgi:hypothetical protein